jgi:hypothetical protein
MYKISRKTGLIILSYLVVVTSVVGIIQAMYEVRKGQSIHFFCPWPDTFVLPWKNAKHIDQLFSVLSKKHEGLQKNLSGLTGGESVSEELWSTTTDAVEEALATVSEIKKVVTNVNRYRTVDSSSRESKAIDSLEGVYKAFYTDIQDRIEIQDIVGKYDALTSTVGRVRLVFPAPVLKNYPLVVGKTMLFYTILNREYLRKYEDDLKTLSIFANSIRPVVQVVWYAIFRTLGDKAIEGNNRWLFYKPDVEYLTRPYITDPRSRVVDVEDKPIRENAIDTIAAFKEELAKHDIELIVMIVPGKPSVYPEKLTSTMRPEEAGTFSNSQRTLKELRTRGIDAIDLFSVLRHERSNTALDTVDPLYLRQDTHWRGRGVRVVAQAMAAFVKSRPLYDQLTQQAEFVVDTMVVDRVGDVGAMTKIPDFKLRSLALSFGHEITPGYQVSRISRDEAGVITGKELFKDDFQHAEIIIIGDSFSRIYQSDDPGSAGWISNFACELQRPVCSIISDGGASTLVREKLARKKGVLKGKKLLIWEFVERDLRFGAEGWKDIKL